MLFSFTTLKWAYILEDDMQYLLAPSSEDFAELKEKHRQRKEDDFLCKDYIPSALSNSIYDTHNTSSFRNES